LFYPDLALIRRRVLMIYDSRSIKIPITSLVSLSFGRSVCWIFFVVQNDCSGRNHRRTSQVRLGREVGKLNVRKEAAQGPRTERTGNRLFRFDKGAR
jgi:hypothetical protein